MRVTPANPPFFNSLSSYCGYNAQKPINPSVANRVYFIFNSGASPLFCLPNLCIDSKSSIDMSTVKLSPDISVIITSSTDDAKVRFFI